MEVVTAVSSTADFISLNVEMATFPVSLLLNLVVVTMANIFVSNSWDK